MWRSTPPAIPMRQDRIGRYGQFAQIETIVSTGTDLFGGVGPSSLPPRALWETGKHNWCMCQDNTGILILRLIPRRSWFVAIVPGCASRAVCETACGGNRRFVCDGHHSVSVTGGCVPRTCYGRIFGTSYGGMKSNGQYVFARIRYYGPS